MSNDLKENVKDSNIWMRLIFMLLFALIFCISRVIIGAVIVVQFLWVLFTGSKNDPLLSFGSQLATFIYQVYRYLSFNTEKRPFPFDDFPSSQALLDDSVEEVKEEATDKPAEQDNAEKHKEPTVVEEKNESDAVDAVSETGVESEDKPKS